MRACKLILRTRANWAAGLTVPGFQPESQFGLSFQKMGSRFPRAKLCSMPFDGLRLLVYLVLAASLAGCSSRNAHLPVAQPLPATPDASYIDLLPGWRLCVITPILKSGEYRLHTASQRVEGNTIAISAGDDFVGYETAYYAINGRRADGVGIRFQSAGITKAGQTNAQSRPLVRLFRLPRWATHVRLIYLERVSHADHDMAVAAAKDMAALETFTRAVQANPAEACQVGRRTYCSWIPAGIAVRPELPKDGEWVPAR